MATAAEIAVVPVSPAGAISPLHPDATGVLTRLSAQADEHAHNARTAATWRVYATDWRLFTRWCSDMGRPVFPEGKDAPVVFVETIRLYVAYLAEERPDKKASAPNTITKKLSSISVAYGTAGVPAHRQLVWAEQVTAVLHGVKRQWAEDGNTVAKKKALRTDGLRKLAQSIGHEDVDLRDRALLLVMFAGAFRRSEMTHLEIRDFEVVDEGLEVTLRRSKADQEGRGLVKGIPYGSRPVTCPVRAWQAWLTVYGRSSGPAFPTFSRWGTLKLDPLGQPKPIDGRSVAEMIQRRAKAAGLRGDWGGHSPRRGFATEAYANDSSEREIMRQGGWRSTTVMRGYADDAGVWKHNAAMKLGL